MTSLMIVPSADLTLLRRPDPAPERGRTVRSFCRRRRVPLLAVSAVLPLYALWWAVLATGGGDLAAQDAWADFAGRHGSSAYNLFWYGGMHTANYSLISPYVMAAVGVRALTVASGLAATWVAAVLVARAPPRRRSSRPRCSPRSACGATWPRGAPRSPWGSPSGSPRVCTSPVRASPGRNVSSSPAPTPPSPPWRPRSRGCSSRSSGRVVCWRGGRVPRSPCCCRPRWWSGRPVSSSPSTGSS